MRFRRQPKPFDWIGTALLVVAAVELGEGEGLLEEDLDVPIIGSTSAEGHSVLPVFSSEQELLAWIPEGAPFIGLQGRDLLRLFLRGDWDLVVADQAGSTSHTLTREEAEALLAHADGA